MNSATQPILPFPPGCRIARLIKREKRFSLLVELDGKAVWAHTNNTGSMMGLLRPGNRVLLSPALNKERKLPWTAEALKKEYEPWIGVNTSVPNRFLSAAFHKALLPWTTGYTCLKREAVHGESRLDGLLTGENLPPLWVECKNVSMVEDDRAAFPDAISERGSKHLNTLIELVKQGCRSTMLYVVQRHDACCFGPADFIDPVYAANLKKAVAAGVEIDAVSLKITEQGLFLNQRLPLVF